MSMIKFFWYKHPVTGEMHSDQRMVGYEAKPLVVNGVECVLDPDYISQSKVSDKHNLAIINKNRECFEADPGYVKKSNPKYIRLRNGHRVRYDPTKHC